ncbi:MAG TPA: uridine diphosphate-N-acetylglucosamine-binding protein YvcK [Bryobacteraceae bacterium]|nr:uridine diphosphate-N-acetylglucosamine-binding protein YvcK [Bryobacteraceae bacterium]
MPATPLTRPLRIVSIGGGNGLSTLLRGLKRYVKAGDGAVEITAIVTVTDDGGSSGRLRREFDVLPPGDIRNCMVALSEDETLLTKLFQYRFSNGRGLKGHSFGNLFLTAMTHLTGDFSQAVKLSCEVLAVLGRIYPSTAANVVLEATLEDDTKVLGETRISRSRSRIRQIETRPRRPKPLNETLEAIAGADLITLGPGSLFTSIIPNLLVEGIPRAIAMSPALKVYFVNLMSQPGETTSFRASDHVAAILRHAGRAWKRSLIDVCVVNSVPITGKALGRYQARAARPVEIDTENLERMGLRVIALDLLRMAGTSGREKIRHDQGVIGAVALELAQKGQRAKLKLTS